MEFLQRVYFVLVLVIVFTSFKHVAAKEQKRQSTQTKVLIGMIAGFCFIAGLAALIITTWCCCCGNGCKSKDSETQVTPVMELITQRIETTQE